MHTSPESIFIAVILDVISYIENVTLEKMNYIVSCIANVLNFVF